MLADDLRDGGRRFRGGPAYEEESLRTWLRNEQRPDRPHGFIGFAVNLPMNQRLRAA